MWENRGPEDTLLETMPYTHADARRPDHGAPHRPRQGWPPIVALVGPTASGKSSLAMDVAERLGGIEIVSVDSMSIYRHMDVGTAKPSLADRSRIRHHLVDLADPSEEYSVARFQLAAAEALADISERNAIALVVAGTGLYLRAVLDGLTLPGRWPEVARELELHASEAGGPERLHERLRRLDPLAAAKILPGNARRIVRALEVTLGSGKPFSSFGPGLTGYEDNGVVQLGISFPTPELDRRIEERIDGQLAGGWLDETAGLLARSEGMSKTARQALGYKELGQHLEGEIGLDEAVEAIKRRTKAFSRRQRSWFRRDPRIAWHDPQTVGAQLAQALDRAAVGG